MKINYLGLLTLIWLWFFQTRAEKLVEARKTTLKREEGLIAKLEEHVIDLQEDDEDDHSSLKTKDPAHK